MMKRFRVIYLLFIALLVGCSESDFNVTPGELIRSISTELDPNNVLRVDVNIEFKEAVQYQIKYWKSDDRSSSKTTSTVSSNGSSSSKLLFLEIDTKYSFVVTAFNSSKQTVSQEYSFNTGLMLPPTISDSEIMVDNMDVELSGYILQMNSHAPGSVYFLNTDGAIVWYEKMEDVVRVATYDPKSQTMSLVLGHNQQAAYAGNQIVVMDLFGNKILNKSAPDLYAHHDIRRMESGDLLILNFVPKAYDLTSQGGSSSEVVWGDGYTIMDIEGNIKKQWDCFGELNPAEDPLIMQPLPLPGPDEMKYKDDWIHANSINWDSNGDFYMSSNWRSELWKIDGETGDVLYRVGPDGNTTIATDNLASGMHSVEPLEPDKVLLLDNGSTTQATRALIYSINQDDNSVEVDLKVTLPTEYSSKFMSNVQLISGDLLMFGSSMAYSIVFTKKDGTIQRVLLGSNTSYRSIYFPEIIY